MLPAMEVLILLSGREIESAVACGKKAVELHPYLHVGRLLYAQALEFNGHWDEALDQYRRTCVMSPDLTWIPAYEAACMAKAGRLGEARRILKDLQRLRKSEYVDAYAMAVLQIAVGARDEAFEELERAVQENSAFLFMVDVDLNIETFRDDPRFLNLRERLRCGAARQASSAA